MKKDEEEDGKEGGKRLRRGRKRKKTRIKIEKE